ncbi:MAG: hypothetical protein M1835_002171 [Candelina submexicana]|nr:MAG: hypothetical protein M1835_002171 [Candelina submexicana]
MAVEVSLGTPLAEALNSVMQPKLEEIGWSTGGLDDSALSEYIVLMLVNGKTQEQIAAELSNDLLNLGPDDSGAIEFAEWLFDQVKVLSKQLNGGGGAAGEQLSVQDGGAVQSISNMGQQQSLQDPLNMAEVGNQTGAQDAEMGDATAGASDGSVPTGPKSMRNGRRNSNKRLIGQLSKAMDRTNDSVLHRVRPQQGTERINTHNRHPPKGPRMDQNRVQRPPIARPMGGMHNGVVPNGGPAGALMTMTPQQQMQLFAMYEEQARMMSQILSPHQQQQMFMGPPGMGGPAINPAFANGQPPQMQQPGRSLFERVEKIPQRQNGNFPKRTQQNGAKHQDRGQQDHAMDTDAPHAQKDADPSSSMEVESSQTTLNEPSLDTVCKFNLTCAKKDCPFAHQSPAAPPGTNIDISDLCTFGAACKNRKCVARHPSPAQKITHQAEQDCKFFPNCTNPTCPFRHPTMPVCRFGADCTKPGCKFTHVKTMCKFDPCMNPTCAFKHAEGQRRGAFGDKVWVADGTKEKEHISERKFVDEDAGEEEELIVPGNGGSTQGSSLGTELVT